MRQEPLTPIIRFAVVQRNWLQMGGSLLGAGSTEEAAYDAAARWLDDRDLPLSPSRVRELCAASAMTRDEWALVLLTQDHPDFEEYLTNQGGFCKTIDGWIRLYTRVTAGEASQ